MDRSKRAMKSLPSRERGLKSKSAKKATWSVASLPSRERGLKFLKFQLLLLRLRRSLRGSVDWNYSIKHILHFNPGRSLRGSVDWNYSVKHSGYRGCCRSLRGSVDWNLCRGRFILINTVAPFAGAWIEIKESEASLQIDKSLPSRERGLK